MAHHEKEMQLDQRMAQFEAAAREAQARRTRVLIGTMAWFRARERGDAQGVASLERADADLTRRLRALEKEVDLPGEPFGRARVFRRLHDAALVLRINDVLCDLVDESCPLCALEGEPCH